jgi:hypothetical protein
MPCNTAFTYVTDGSHSPPQSGPPCPSTAWPATGPWPELLQETCEMTRAEADQACMLVQGSNCSIDWQTSLLLLKEWTSVLLAVSMCCQPNQNLARSSHTLSFKRATTQVHMLPPTCAPHSSPALSIPACYQACQWCSQQSIRHSLPCAQEEPEPHLLASSLSCS